MILNIVKYGVKIDKNNLNDLSCIAFTSKQKSLPKNHSGRLTKYLQTNLSYNSGAITSATTDINFNKMFKDGPEVSLKGSPTVSPTTVAL